MAIPEAGIPPSNFYDPVDHATITGIQAALKKNQQIQRRYLVAVSFLPDTILAPVTLAEILVQQTNGMKLDSSEPGYANKVLLMREKARNLVFLAAIRKASAVVNLKEALGTKGAIKLNSATRIAIKLAQPALNTVDNYFIANFDEIISSDELFHISPHVKMTLSEDVAGSELNVYGQFNDEVQTLIRDNFKEEDLIGNSAKAKALRIKRAKFEREVFIISRLISATDNNTVRGRLVLNISKDAEKKYVDVTPDFTGYSKFKPAKNKDKSIRNVLHLSEHTVTSIDADIPEWKSEEFDEWKVRTITLADLALMANDSFLEKMAKHKFVNTEIFGIAPFTQNDEVEFADVAVSFSDSSLYRHLTPGSAFSLKDMFSNPNFTDERLETCENLFGDHYEYNLITHNDIKHFIKGNNFLPDSATRLINRITASNKLNVTFINVQDTLIKADANGDVLNTMEIGDQDQIERALMLQNEKNDFSLEYISVFADLINKYGTPSQDHVADTSIPAAISQALRNDEMALGTLKTKVDITKEVSVIMRNVMRNDKGMTIATANLNVGQFKLDAGRIKFSIIGDFTNSSVEVLERINCDQLELITSKANYMEGEDTFDVIDTFTNHPIKVIDNNLMNTLELDFNFDSNSLKTSYDEYIHGICYAPSFNETMNSSVAIGSLISGANVGNLPQTDLYNIKSTAHNITIMSGLNVNSNSIEVAFNLYRLFESNGEVETLYFNHVGIQHKKRIAIILNQNVAKRTIHVRKLQEEYSVKFKIKENYKLQDFMKLRYHKTFDTNNLLMNNSYGLAGIEYHRRVQIAQEFGSINITLEYYRHLKELAMKIVMDLSTLQSFFRLFTNIEVYEYSQNDMLAAHITLYKAKFVSLAENEQIIVHDIIFATITAIIAKYDSNVLPRLEILSDKKIAGSITEAEREIYARIIAEHPVACWTSKVTRSYSIPDQIRNIYKEIAGGMTHE